MKTYSSNYAKAIHSYGNSFVMCNNLPEIDPTIWDNVSENFDWDKEVFQYFISDCSEEDTRYLMEFYPSLCFTYSEKLECYILLVTHFGTAWGYVSIETTNPNFAAALGEK